MGAGRTKTLLRALPLAALLVVRSQSAAAQTPVEVDALSLQSAAVVRAAAVESALAQNPAIDLAAQSAVATIQPAAKKQSNRGALTQAVIATVAGNMFDGVTTIVGVHSGRAREVNPILGQSTTRIILMKSLFTLPQILAEKHLVDHGHPTTARWVGYIVGGVAAAVAVHNVQVITR